MSKFIPQGMGWIPDQPDPRDYTYRHQEILPILQQLKPCPEDLPDAVDLRHGDEGEVFFADVEDQGPLHSSTSLTVLSLIEYFERRIHGRTFEGSTLFLYKMARKMRRTTGDCGADLRTTLKALRRFGVPPGEFWHTHPERFDAEPCDVSLIGYARDYQDMSYFRLDAHDASLQRTKSRDFHHSLGSRTLRTVKSFLSGGFPVAFGFSVSKSMSSDPNIPYRPAFDSFRGGQAALAVGYDDHKDTSPKGVILIRNSWGETWGEAGYGWLPYAYVEHHLATNFWGLLRKNWRDSHELLLPAVLAPRGICETETEADLTQ